MSTMSLAVWYEPRKSVIRKILLGNVTWSFAFFAAWAAWPAMQPRATASERLALAMQIGAAVSFVVAAMVSACLRLFDTTGAEDPLAGNESPAWKIHQRALTNTVEQAWLFLPVFFGLAVRVHPAHVRILPILALLWCVGRVSFWIGYRVDPSWRAIGFDWTFNSSLLALGWFAYTLVA